MPEFGSIANTDILSDPELATNKYLPEGPTLIDAGVSPAVTREPIGDIPPVAELTSNEQTSPVLFAT